MPTSVIAGSAFRLEAEAALACAGAVVHVAHNLRQAEHTARSNKFDALVTDLDPDVLQPRKTLRLPIPAVPNGTPAGKLVEAAIAAIKSA